MHSENESNTRRWVAGWKDAAKALDRVKTDELRALTDEESARMFEALTIDSDTVWISPDRRDGAGLVEQQRLFMLSNEHPARHQRRL